METGRGRRWPAVVATDLDGTLLRSDHTVGRRTLAALDTAQTMGIRVVFVTGRPPRWLAPAVEATGHRGVAVCANGALVVDLATDEVLATRTMTPATGLAVLHRLREADPDLTFGVEYADGFAHEPAYPGGTRRAIDDDGHDAVTPDVRDLFDRPVTKLLAKHEHRTSADLTATLAPLVGDLVEVTYSSTNLLEMAARGVTKASTLARLVDDDGVARDDVLAFGDMPNDLPMLEWAGRSVAVANAHPDVLAAVDDVTASNDDDGVGRYLERLLTG